MPNPLTIATNSITWRLRTALPLSGAFSFLLTIKTANELIAANSPSGSEELGSEALRGGVSIRLAWRHIALTLP
jgi:hypothetical protein